MSYVFLSHSHKDKDFARRLAAALRHAGHIVWIDEAEILVGDSLIAKIEEGLDKVDFVIAILSKASIESEWVRKELEAAMNREIGARRVVVLPALVEDAELPPFLRGKRYADFRGDDRFESGLAEVLQRLGRVDPPPVLPEKELERLREELSAAKKLVDQFSKDVTRQRRIIATHQSPSLRAAIEKANREFPEHRTVNEAYAFEVGAMPVTLDYLLWAIAKERRKGSHPLAILVHLEKKWDNVRMMLEAYQDYLGIASSNVKRPKTRRKTRSE